MNVSAQTRSIAPPTIVTIQDPGLHIGDGQLSATSRLSQLSAMRPPAEARLRETAYGVKG